VCQRERKINSVCVKKRTEIKEKERDEERERVFVYVQ